MLADSYIHPYIMIFIIIISVLKWIDSIITSKDPRGISAVLARMYFLYFYIILSINVVPDPELRFFVFTLGLGALLLDESVYWLTQKLVDVLNKVKNSVKKSPKK